MEIIRSLLFIPSDNLKFLDKIDTLKSDAFILDLEDSVSFNQKIQARENIRNKLEKIDLNGKKEIFIRINDFDSGYFQEDIKETINPKI